MTHQIKFTDTKNTKGEFKTPSTTINYKTTNNNNALLLVVGTTFAIFNLTTNPIYSENEDYRKILTNVVTEMLSNTEDFSDINQYINDNFWDLV